MRTWFLGAAIAVLASGCVGSLGPLREQTKPEIGSARDEAPQPVLAGALMGFAANAKVTVFDQAGARRSVFSDGSGRYVMPLAGLKAPLLIVSVAGGKPLAAIVAALPETSAVANVNSLTDKIASDVAIEFRFSGPEEMVKAGRAPRVSEDSVRAKTASLRASLYPALKTLFAGEADQFDPLTLDMERAGRKATELLTIVEHHRTSSSAGSGRGETILMDPAFRELTRLAPLDLQRAQREKSEITAFGTVRIFVAGEATASYYGPHLAPRMGWAQALESRLREDVRVKLINLAQPGRSARSFASEGWLDVIERNIREGDYLFVQFGLSDQRCGEGGALSRRDLMDLALLCSYPGFDARIPSDKSFANALSRYIKLARDYGATPVLLTPVTRINLDQKNAARGIFPIRQTTHVLQRGAFPGDYSRTVRFLAKSARTALIDVDAKSIGLFNKVGDPGWKEYYLAVDPKKYPFYSEGAIGNELTPDNAVFQEKGARVVADMVLEGLRDGKLAVASAFQ